jgi:hypothetical protein
MRAEDTVRQHVVLEDSERKECAEHKRELHECVMPMPTLQHENSTAVHAPEHE